METVSRLIILTQETKTKQAYSLSTNTLTFENQNS